METFNATDLNPAQKIIYSRSSIRRTYPELDETSDLCGLYITGSDLLVVYSDGSEKVLPTAPIKDNFVKYTQRTKDFFAYLGSNYQGPKPWIADEWIIQKGWGYLAPTEDNETKALLQAQWDPQFYNLKDKEELAAVLNTGFGYLFTPDKKCTCGSYLRQVEHLSEFQAEIPGYQPNCIHLAWYKQYRAYMEKRTQVLSQTHGVVEKAVAWAYDPPHKGAIDGRFIMMWTTHGHRADPELWKCYKPNEWFTQKDVWKLFSSMLSNGFVPFEHNTLPQLALLFKGHDLS